MSQRKCYLSFIISTMILTMTAQAQDNHSNNYALMTAHDIKSNSVSNITITNHTSQPVTASALFITSFDTNDCSICNGNLTGGDNLGGAIASPVTFQVNQSLAIGKNYLYNMLYNSIYYINNVGGASPCKLPGCSWFEDSRLVTGWCVNINIASLDSNYTYSHYTRSPNPAAAIPPYSEASDSLAYDYSYSLINPSTLGPGTSCLGPITCDDKTLTCQVSTPQNESFEPYS